MILKHTKIIKTISAEIYYEDGVPFVNYEAEVEDWLGCRYKLSIPKMDLTPSSIEISDISEKRYANNQLYNCKCFRQMFIKDKGNDCILTPIEREMTIDEIEAKLGYKIKLKEQ